MQITQIMQIGPTGQVGQLRSIGDPKQALSAAFDALDPARSLSESAAKPTLGEAARDFEALLLHQFLRAANKPLVGETPLGGGRTERLYREMFFGEISKLAAERGGLGLAAQLGRSVGDVPDE